ncbi:MAG: PAS domain S-box protein [Acidobacteriota bacterium]
MSTVPLRALIVDDDEDDYAVVLEMLSSIEGTHFETEWASSYEDGLRAVETSRHDIYLIDYYLGGWTGLDLIKEITRRDLLVPVILLTGRGSRKVDIEAMEAGATDYLVKGEFNALMLERSLRYAREHNRAKQALRESEERYRSFFENSLDGVMVTLTDGSILAANPEACRILGRSEAEIRQIGRDGIVDYSNSSFERFDAERMERGSCRAELTLIRKDGTRFPVELSSSLFKDRHGRDSTIIVFRDITERKRIEADLRESEIRLRSILDHAPAIIYIKDMQNRYVFINRACEDLLDLKLEDIRGKTPYEVLPREVAEQFVANDRRVLESLSPIEVEEIIPREDGLHIVLSILFPLLAADGKPYAICGISNDITERKQMEDELRMAGQELELRVRERTEALREANSKLEERASLLNLAHDPILVRDLDERIVYWNEGATRTYGWKREEVVGMVAHGVLRTIFPRPLHEILAELHSKGFWNGELRHTTRNGQTVFVDSSWVLQRDAAGNPVKILETNRDITQKKSSEATLAYQREALQGILDNIPVAICRFDPAGRAEFINREYERVLGWTLEDLQGADPICLWFDDPETRREVKKYIDDATCSWRSFVCRTKSGEEIEMSWSNVRLSDGSRIGIGIDIRERRRMQRELDRTLSLLHAVSDMTTDCIYVKDRELRLLFVNPAVLETMGKSAGEILGKRETEWYPDRNEAEILLKNDRRIMGEKRTQVIEERVTSAAGTRVYLSTKSPYMDEKGDVLGVIGISRDITERKRLEDELLNKSEHLQEVNTALKVILRQREDDRKEMGKSLLTNVKTLVLPYVEKLKQSQLNSSQATVVEILESHINEILSPFSRTLGLQHANLTPTETRVAALIRDGKHSGEIAEILNISEKTVCRHRDNIRSKLGLRGARTSLRAHLLDLA